MQYVKSIHQLYVSSTKYSDDAMCAFPAVGIATERCIIVPCCPVCTRTCCGTFLLYVQQTLLYPCRDYPVCCLSMHDGKLLMNNGEGVKYRHLAQYSNGIIRAYSCLFSYVRITYISFTCANNWHIETMKCANNKNYSTLDLINIKNCTN